MPAQIALSLNDLAVDTKKTVDLNGTKILLVRTADIEGAPTLFALEAECPHAKAPLEKGAVCNGRLVCPFHTGTFALATGKLLEPPPLRDLKRYAVHIENGQILVDPQPLPSLKPEPVGEGKHFVFAGGGAATAAALCYIRDAGFAGKATVIEPDEQEPMDRTQLSKMALAGTKPLDTLSLLEQPKDNAEPALPTYERVRASVTAWNQIDRSLTLDNGANVAYDALLLATGSKPKRLPVEGGDLPHVFTIRHTSDLVHMEPLLQTASHVAIIGDSFIAFEAASALRGRGLAVTVIAQSKLPFEKKFGEAVAEAMMALHRREGVNLHTEAHVAAITPVAVSLATGAEIPADLVITAIGVEPVTAYAPHLPAGKRGGFSTDATLGVAPHVWAAGDIASVDEVRIEHWRLAQQHGRIGAAAMLAEAAAAEQPRFDGVPLFWTFHFGKRLNYAGHADTWDSIDIHGDVAKLNFVAFYIQEGFVKAALGCGQDHAIASLMEPMRSGPLSPQTAAQLAGLQSPAA